MRILNTLPFRARLLLHGETQGVASLALSAPLAFQAALAKIIVAISKLVVERLC